MKKVEPANTASPSMGIYDSQIGNVITNPTGSINITQTFPSPTSPEQSPRQFPAKDSNTPNAYLRQLLAILRQYFDKRELHIMCFSLAVDYDELTGENTAEKSVSLITYMDRARRIRELVDYIREVRPSVQLDYPHEQTAS